MLPGIRSIRKNLIGSSGPLAVAVFLCLSFLVGGALFAQKSHGSVSRGVLGGPLSPEDVFVAEDDGRAVLSAEPSMAVSDEHQGIVVSAGTNDEIPSLVASGGAVGALATRAGVVTYKVSKGDTLSKIARDFGISVQTIIGANPKVRAGALSIGQELVILPSSGVVYETKEGDTLDSLAGLFGIPPKKIQEANHATDFAKLPTGTSLVIPGMKEGAGISRELAGLPDIRGYFVEPTQGFNWGKLHDYNAVDIANACGTSVKSAAEGLVTDAEPEGWNTGYGHFVLIEHPNGAKTRYAHLGEVAVMVGDYVSQAEKIGAIGNTGNVHGITGCHLHFEVYGAKNPFIK